MKEAIGKAMGLGMVDAEQFSVVTGRGDDLSGWRAVVDAPDRRWSVTRVAVEGAVVATAIAGDRGPCASHGKFSAL